MADVVRRQVTVASSSGSDVIGVEHMRGIRFVTARCVDHGVLGWSLAFGAALLATGCGSSSAATTAASPSSHASPAPQLDSCVVGTWKSTSDRGTTTYTSHPGSPTVQFSGSGGEILKVGPDGTVDFQYGGATPVQGTGSDGAAYVITTTGSAAGRATTGNGQLTYILADSNSMHITVTRNGAVFAGGSIDAPQQFTYTCTAGKTMTWTQKLTNFDEVITWVPA